MAFIQKSGSKFQVRHGVNGDLLSSFSSQAKANKELKRLHAKNNPTGMNRGASAKSNVKKRDAGKVVPVGKGRKNSAAADSKKARRKGKRKR